MMIPYLVFLGCVLMSLLLSACPTQQSAPTTYYVAPTGSDSNTGTSASTPFLTPNKCQSVAKAGDICTFAAGKYAGSGSAVLYITVSGTAAAPIVFQSSTPGGAVFDGGNARSYGIYLSGNSSYITVQDFEIKNVTLHGVGAFGTSSIRVLRNKIHHCGQNGIYIDAVNAGSVVEDNEIYTVGTSGIGHGIYFPADNGRITRNYIHNIQRYGIQLYSASSGVSADRNEIDHNVIRDFGANTTEDGGFDDGIVLDGAENKVHHNLIYSQSGTTDRGIDLQFSSTLNNQIYNNTIRGVPTGIYIGDLATGNRLTNNISYGNKTNLTASATAQATNTLTTNLTGTSNPGLVSSTDLSLAPGAAALGAGTDVGFPCNGPCEVGAFEVPDLTVNACSIDPGAANTLRCTWQNAAAPPLAGCIATDFVITVSGEARLSTSCLVTAQSRTDVTFTGPAVTAEQIVTMTYTAGSLRDSSAIGGAVGNANQKAFTISDFPVINNTTGGTPPNPVDTVTLTVSWNYGLVDSAHGAATHATAMISTNGGAYTTYCTVAAPLPSCTGAALSMAQAYAVKVVAENAAGAAPDSNVVTYTPPAPAVPSAAENVTISSAAREGRI